MKTKNITLKICIDARHVHGKMQGLDRYILEVLNHLPEVSDTVLYILHNDDFPHEYIKHPERFTFVLSKTRGCSPWQHFSVPFALRKLHLDVYYYPYIDPPIIPPAKINVFMVHDLNHYFFSRSAATTNPLAIAAAKFFINLSAFTYNKIMVNSEFVARDLTKHVPQASRKTIVHHLGFSPERFPPCNSDYVQQNIPGKYILYVGNNRPHKNLEGLLKGFSFLQKSHEDVVLVIAGNMSKRFVDIKDVLIKLGLSECVVIKESVTDDELALLYKNALVFVYPSLSEGFGLPLLEAMHFGTPIAASETSCIPEIAGDSLVYFDPHSPESIARSVERLLENDDLRETLVKKGREQVKKFTWSKTAGLLLSALAA